MSTRPTRYVNLSVSNDKFTFSIFFFTIYQSMINRKIVNISVTRLITCAHTGHSTLLWKHGYPKSEKAILLHLESDTE